MAKKSRKRLGRFEKDQSGCMWSLISIFDFRQARSSQKLLPDRKRGSKRIVGASYPDINLESLRDSCEICTDITETLQSGASTIDTSKMSVKELMDEEMCGEPDQRKHGSIADGDAKQTAAGDGGHGRKNRRRTRSMTSLDVNGVGLAAADYLGPAKPTHRKHKSSSSVDLNVMVEELCNRIYQKDISSLKPGQDGNVATQPIEDPSIIEKKLGEATKVLVDHFTEGKSLGKDGKIQPSKELMDALQILDSNKDVFLKLLQDPNSQLVKGIKSLQDIQVEEGKFKLLTGSNLLEQDMGNGKQQNHFWRRFKGLERNSSKKSGTSEDLNRIVVLKPGPLGSRSLDMDSSSIPGSPQSIGDKGQAERVSLAFSFSEFKKKLKQAMRKDQHGLIHNGMPHELSDEQPNLANRDKKVGAETVGVASPRRDHFFIERIPKFSVELKTADKTGKKKDGKLCLERDTVLTPEQRVSNIYAEAKKHLAEIVGNSDADVEPLGRQVPKSLGRILSYSGYSSPTLCSPRIEGETRLSTDEECQSDVKTRQVIQENNVSHPGQGKQESENGPCVASNKPLHEAEVSTLEPCTSDGLPCESDISKITHDLEVAAAEDKSPDSEFHRESVEMPSEPCSQQTTSSTVQIDSSSTSRSSEENSHSTSLDLDTYDENEASSSSPVASTSISSMTGKNEDLDAMSDATSGPSPISVLEPLFKEDDISPPAIKSLTAAEPIQPRQILFEEEMPVLSERAPSIRTCIEGDKYMFEFVKAVVQMSGLTWDELLRRCIFSDHLIEPSLLDEVDFLPDLLSCDFNLLFDLINEVLIEICRLNFSCMLSLAKPFVQPELKGKDIFSEIWKGVDWYLKLEGPPRTLDHIVSKDLAKSGPWMDLRPDSENIGIQVQETILEELVEETIVSWVSESLDRESPALLQAELEESEISIEI